MVWTPALCCLCTANVCTDISPNVMITYMPSFSAFAMDDCIFVAAISPVSTCSCILCFCAMLLAVRIVIKSRTVVFISFKFTIIKDKICKRFSLHQLSVN